MQEEKRDLRRRMVALRAAWPPDARAEASRRIRATLAALPELSTAGAVLGFWSMSDRHEVDVRALLTQLAAGGRTVGLPVVPTQRTDRTLGFRAFEGPERLEPGPFGTVHPHASAAPLEPSSTDIVLVPALAADFRGFRLGWGAGYYDRWLERHPIVAICPIFDACLVDSLPTETHDRAVTLIVTERRVLRVSPSA